MKVRNFRDINESHVLKSGSKRGALSAGQDNTVCGCFKNEDHISLMPYKNYTGHRPFRAHISPGCPHLPVTHSQHQMGTSDRIGLQRTPEANSKASSDAMQR